MCVFRCHFHPFMRLLTLDSLHWPSLIENTTHHETIIFPMPIVTVNLFGFHLSCLLFRRFLERVMPACQINQNIGNCYTGSVFSSLLSVVSTQVRKSEEKKWFINFFPLKTAFWHLTFAICFNLSRHISPLRLFYIYPSSFQEIH